MTNFTDLDIKPNVVAFVGDKIKAKNLLNVPIIVLDFKIEPSKAKPGTECLTLQIEKSGEKRIVFTSSKILMDQIRRVNKSDFPFATTIRADKDYYEFT